MIDDGVAHIGPAAGQHVEPARRQPALVDEEIAQGQRRQRRLAGGLEDYRAARGDRGRHLVSDQVEGEVKRADRAHHADRHPQREGQLALAAIARFQRHGLAAELARLGRREREGAHGSLCFDARGLEWFGRFGGDDPREPVLIGGDGGRGGVEDLGPAPLRERVRQRGFRDIHGICDIARAVRANATNLRTVVGGSHNEVGSHIEPVLSLSVTGTLKSYPWRKEFTMATRFRRVVNDVDEVDDAEVVDRAVARPPWSPAQFVALLIGAIFAIIGGITLTKTGINFDDISSRHESVAGMDHTALLGVIELAVGLFLIGAGAIPGGARGAMTFFGVILLGFGIVMAIDNTGTTMHRWLGEGSDVGWFFGIAGAILLVAAMVSPVIFGTDRQAVARRSAVMER